MCSLFSHLTSLLFLKMSSLFCHLNSLLFEHAFKVLYFSFQLCISMLRSNTELFNTVNGLSNDNIILLLPNTNSREQKSCTRVTLTRCC
ncbi:hypothetical protein ACB098_11G028000 [Castanea mollissima]